MSSSQASELARRLADAWVRHANEHLASIDGRCGGVLSRECGQFRAIRRLLSVVAASDHARIPPDIREQIIDIGEHVRKHHPAQWHLFFEDPGPAATALHDQLQAARRDAAREFGQK